MLTVAPYFVQNNDDASSSGDKITVGDVNGTGIVIGKRIKIGQININSLNKELEKVPNEYADSLKNFHTI